jgi:hydrogenase nickel incorporation protein HypA/HybF
MHEVGIASSILECVAAELQKHPGAQLTSVCVRIGELSNVDKDALDFAFEALTRDTNLQQLKLIVEWCPRRQKCTACSEEFAVRDFELACPKCGSAPTTCISGTELDIAYIELEEEPCAKS